SDFAFGPLPPFNPGNPIAVPPTLPMGGAIIGGTTGLFPPLALGMPGLIGVGSATYSSEMYSAEMNLRYQLAPRFTALGGFRWVMLDEEFLMVPTDAAGNPFPYFTEVRNDLFGFQFGGEWVPFIAGRLRGEAEFKGGIYQNYSDHFAVVQDVANGITSGPINESRQHAAFVGEIRLKLLFQLTSNLALRTGYEFLWLENVAVATDQVDISNFPAGVGTDFQGNVFYHGLTIGAEAWW
ncbi:MAG: BBP7 family outer membrane beta-barrel protein, partial [Planctomycetales bacterium]